MDATGIALLALGGLVAGVVNTLAGGGSLLTVPLLVLVGLPGTLANGTNRVGILVQSLVASWRFRAEGVSALSAAAPLLLPATLGAALGAHGIAQVGDASFERLFGLVMLVLLVPVLRGAGMAARAPARPWSRGTRIAVFFALGLYGGALQAGLGIFVLFALARAGYDLVRANAIKMILNAVLALVAVPVFLLEGQIAWTPAAALAGGYAAGGALGARIAVRGGERVIRPVLVVCVVALAGRMLGLY